MILGLDIHGYLCNGVVVLTLEVKIFAGRQEREGAAEYHRGRKVPNSPSEGLQKAHCCRN